MTNGIEPCIERAKAYAPYSDLIWMETGTPDLEAARRFAEAVKSEHPDQMLAYNCSPSFNWKKHLDDETIAKFQNELGQMGFTFQFITLAGFHSLNYASFNLAKGYKEEQMKPTWSCRRPSSPPRARLHLHTPPARGRHRLLRRHLHHPQPRVLHSRAEGLDRRRTVPLSPTPVGRD